MDIEVLDTKFGHSCGVKDVCSRTAHGSCRQCEHAGESGNARGDEHSEEGIPFVDALASGSEFLEKDACASGRQRFTANTLTCYGGESRNTPSESHGCQDHQHPGSSPMTNDSRSCTSANALPTAAGRSANTSPAVWSAHVQQFGSHGCNATSPSLIRTSPLSYVELPTFKPTLSHLPQSNLCTSDQPRYPIPDQAMDLNNSHRTRKKAVFENPPALSKGHFTTGDGTVCEYETPSLTASGSERFSKLTDCGNNNTYIVGAVGSRRDVLAHIPGKSGDNVKTCPEQSKTVCAKRSKQQRSAKHDDDNGEVPVFTVGDTEDDNNNDNSDNMNASSSGCKARSVSYIRNLSGGCCIAALPSPFQRFSYSSGGGVAGCTGFSSVGVTTVVAGAVTGVIQEGSAFSGGTECSMEGHPVAVGSPARPPVMKRNSSTLAPISESEMLDIMERTDMQEVLSSMPPCQCDACLMAGEGDSGATASVTGVQGAEEGECRKHPVLRRQSSWKKIRSIIRWSPFIQVFKKHRYPWIQLAGHQGNFQAGDAGSVLKKLDNREHQALEKLMNDRLAPFVPEFRGVEEKNGESYVQLQDLLCEFNSPCVMDIKMGVRTYLEEELEKARKKPTMRKDMYQKMVDVDSSAPTAEEHAAKAVTKPRYMQWRDQMSSSVDLGFRIEGIKKSDGASSKDFKKTKSRESVVEVLKNFIGDKETVLTGYLSRLREICATQETSDFFQKHEVVGSSLLFVHDSQGAANVWMIDFGKTEPLPDHVTVNHRDAWVEGNHEDGYLFGLDNIIRILEELQASSSA